jgi:hypothetical protein
MTKLMAEAIRRMVDQKNNDVERANERIIERMKNAPDRGAGGVIAWTRDELHER